MALLRIRPSSFPPMGMNNSTKQNAKISAIPTPFVRVTPTSQRGYASPVFSCNDADRPVECLQVGASGQAAFRPFQIGLAFVTPLASRGETVAMSGPAGRAGEIKKPPEVLLCMMMEAGHGPLRRGDERRDRPGPGALDQAGGEIRLRHP